MSKKTTKGEIIDFLRESNAIEGVFDDGSLAQALEAWRFLLTKKKLTIGVILKVHKILMLNQPLAPDEKGYFRKVPVWVGDREGLKWQHIPLALESWLGDVATSVKIPGIDGENIRLDHIIYEKIHPFVDGNGRTGRLFLNWQRIQVGLPILVIRDAEKSEYYKWFN